MIRLISPEDNVVVQILTPFQRAYRGGGEVDSIDYLNLKRSEGEDCTFPMQVEFTWEADNDDSLLEISEDPAFTDVRAIRARGGCAHAGNFCMNRRYFWRVDGGESRSFITEDAAPRWICAEGISNVRDLGAWKTADGRRIRQGLIFRGTEMDSHHEITDNGRRVMRDELHIKTDLDLRREEEVRAFESPLGSNVVYKLITTRSYAGFYDEEQKPVCRALFEVLADSRNYPIYFHCWGGADRTGTLALMLHAVLGMSEEDILLDYELTSLSIWGDRSRSGDYFKSLLSALDAYGGAQDSLNVKAVNFLKSCGITDDTLEKIRNNLLCGG